LILPNSTELIFKIDTGNVYTCEKSDALVVDIVNSVAEPAHFCAAQAPACQIFWVFSSCILFIKIHKNEMKIE
jgi:hypothetical protein